MGRTKQYNREDLLNKAVELFRNQGFNGTSTAELVEELGVNRKSMYAEFGTKQELFEATLDHYGRNHLSRVLAPIEAEDADIEGIKEAFINYASASEGWFNGKGCLMCNTAVERAALDPASGRFAEEYFERINAGFVNALENGRRKGEIKADADVESLAHFLTTSFVGVAASIRAEASSEQLYATAEVVASLLEANA